MDPGHDDGGLDEPGLDELLAAARDPDPDERRWAAAHLPIRAVDLAGAQLDLVAATLVALTTDPDPDVRDWATCGLGRRLDLDSPAVRAALRARIGDPGGHTGDEAVCGLARRRDPLAPALIAAALAEPEVAPLFFQAAAYLRDPALAERLWAFHDEDTDADDDVRIALRECDSELRAARDDFVLRLMDLVFARAAGHDPVFSCGVLDLDISLEIGARAGTWDVEGLRRRSGGDPNVAVELFLAGL